MPRIVFGNHEFECRENENLLDAFFRNKIDIPFSCRNGTCHACVTKVVSGEIDVSCQTGLNQHLKNSGHILPCQCYPTSDLVLKTPTDDDIYNKAVITEIRKLSGKIYSVTLKPDFPTKSFKTGQFINIKTDLDNKVRSYSLTNIYQDQNTNLNIHVKAIPDGIFSTMISEGTCVGKQVKIHYPLGATHITENESEGMLLIATGSGLGAVFAIASHALQSGYKKQIILAHRVWNNEDMYCLDELKKLTVNFNNFQYSAERLNETEELPDIFSKFQTMSGWEVYLYGNPVVVEECIRQSMQKGCQEKDILSDAFEYAAIPEYYRADAETNKMEFIEEGKRIFETDLSMWNALKEGVLLNEILNDFYDKVLKDDSLSPFFKGVTKEHIIGKQYAFLNQIFTGRDCYFGDRPRNAHHWMIISDKLFDYREKLFKESCIKCGLEDPWLSQLLELNESYRNVIVKTKMWPRIDQGEIKPIKGYEDMVLEIGSLCDGCGKELFPGELVHFHALTGEMFCSECLDNKE